MLGQHSRDCFFYGRIGREPKVRSVSLAVRVPVFGGAGCYFFVLFWAENIGIVYG